MQIHHLNCATLCPRTPSALTGGDLVCHCLLIETPSSGLVLVDTGLGTDDVRERNRLPWTFRTFLNPALDRAETARSQVESLGHSVDDVRHVILTHADLDHAGGLADFPHAAVHLHETERASLDHPPGLLQKDRRLAAHWRHGPDWRTYAPDGGAWHGFDAVRDLDGLPPEILLVPLAGHTDGHSGVAIRDDDGWLLHAGDAYFRTETIDHGRSPFLIRTFETMLETDRSARLNNQKRLRELRRDADDVSIFCAHDSREFDALS